jgi:hypothetical protein
VLCNSVNLTELGDIYILHLINDVADESTGLEALYEIIRRHAHRELSARRDHTALFPTDPCLCLRLVSGKPLSPYSAQCAFYESYNISKTRGG